MKAELEPLMTTDEVAAILRVNPKTVRRLVNAGRLPCIRFGRSVRFASGDVLAWLSARKEG
jgi:excisionase family DNA binding protein